MKSLLPAAILLAALVAPVHAAERKDNGQYWQSSRIYTVRDASGQMQTGSWQVLERSQQRCQLAAKRAEMDIANRYPGGRVTGTKRYTPCHRISTRNSPG